MDPVIFKGKDLFSIHIYDTIYALSCLAVPVRSHDIAIIIDFQCSMTGFVTDLLQNHIFIGVITKVPYTVGCCHSIKGSIIRRYFSAAPILDIEIVSICLKICHLVSGQFYRSGLGFSYVINNSGLDLIIAVIRITLEIIIALCRLF